MLSWDVVSAGCQVGSSALLGQCFTTLELFYQSSPSPLCPSLPGGQLLCSYDQFHHDPSAGSRPLCRGEDLTLLLDPQGRKHNGIPLGPGGNVG